MEPTSTSLAMGGILGSVGAEFRAPNRGVRQSDHDDRSQDIEPTSVAPDYPSCTVIRADRAARVKVTARRVIFHLASSYPYAEVFREVSRRLMGSRPSPEAGAG